jgi:hypothetical protein
VEFPLIEEYRRDIDSRVADIKNVGEGHPARSSRRCSCANCGGLPWAHIDFSSTVMSDGFACHPRARAAMACARCCAGWRASRLSRRARGGGGAARHDQQTGAARLSAIGAAQLAAARRQRTRRERQLAIETGTGAGVRRFVDERLAVARQRAEALSAADGLADGRVVAAAAGAQVDDEHLAGGDADRQSERGGARLARRQPAVPQRQRGALQRGGGAHGADRIVASG